MKIKLFLQMLFTVSLTVSAGLAFANDGDKENKDGVVHGYVIDAVTKKPVAGVIISATSAKNKNEKKEVQTDASGYFKFPELPAGELKFQFEKKGYKQQKKNAMTVKEGTIVKFNVEIEITKTEVEDYEHPFFRLDGTF
jgi:hypothetical protein